MKEKMQKLIDDLRKNPSTTIKEDSFVAYRELKAVTLFMDVEEL